MVCSHNLQGAQHLHAVGGDGDWVYRRLLLGLQVAVVQFHCGDVVATVVVFVLCGNLVGWKGDEIGMREGMRIMAKLGWMSRSLAC